MNKIEHIAIFNYNVTRIILFILNVNIIQIWKVLVPDTLISDDTNLQRNNDIKITHCDYNS